MKTIGFDLRFFSIIAAFVFVLPAYEAFGSLSYDWDAPRDGDILQGWTKADDPPFDGDLEVQLGSGNPGGSMRAIDTASGGFLWAQAPDELSGDLSAYTGISWDEFIQPRDFLRQATFIILQQGHGEDKIQWQSEVPTGTNIVTNTWNPRFETFDMDDPSFSWVQVAREEKSFGDIIKEVSALFISMDTTELLGIEARVDNFTVVPIPGAEVPIPGAVWLLGSGLIGLVVIRRKFRS